MFGKSKGFLITGAKLKVLWPSSLAGGYIHKKLISNKLFIGKIDDKINKSR